MFRRFGSIAACATLALTVMALPAQAAKPGNSPTAKYCQKGGWQQFVTSSGASFASEEQCTSYGAQGGALVPASLVAPCLNGGWQNLLTTTGEAFADEAACRSYAAGGGQLQPKPTVDPRCANDGYLDAYRQDGSAFASEAACDSYVEGGGQLVLLKAVSAPGVDGFYYLDTTGSGLQPGSSVTYCVFDREQDWLYCARYLEPVAEDGGFAYGVGLYCSSGWDVAYVIATSATGSTVQSRQVATPPC